MELTIKEIQKRAREIVETGSKKQAILLLDEISAKEIINDDFDYVYEVEERTYMLTESTDEKPTYVSKAFFNSLKKALAYFDEGKFNITSLASHNAEELANYVDRDRVDAMGAYVIVDGKFVNAIYLQYHVVGIGEEQNYENLRLNQVIQEKIKRYWKERENEHTEH